ncbi:MAG: hypothetical protein LUE92_11580 [Clostridiales bacterium]|nr:hypothetical protein [Clostridiales bacterium]
MTLKNYIRKGVLVAVIFILIGWLGQYFYMVDGEVDWFRFALLYGILMGIPHMLVVVPLKWDISGMVGMMAFCVLIGGLFGCIIAAGLAVRAAFYLAGYPVCLMFRTFRGRTSRG